MCLGLSDTDVVVAGSVVVVVDCVVVLVVLPYHCQYHKLMCPDVFVYAVAILAQALCLK